MELTLSEAPATRADHNIGSSVVARVSWFYQNIYKLEATTSYSDGSRVDIS